MSDRPRESAGPPRLLAISDRKVLPDGDLEGWLSRLATAAGSLAGGVLAGVLAVQLREKDLDDLALYELALAARRRLPPPLRLLINGRPDIALAAGADGVHLPAAGLPAGRVVARWGDRLLVGVSAHSPEEVDAARRAGAGYATFGPVYPTPSKAAWGPPPGLSGLRAAAGLGLPLLALGGVDAERLVEVVAAGAFGMGGIRCFASPPALDATLARAVEVLGAGWTHPPGSA